MLLNGSLLAGSNIGGGMLRDKDIVLSLFKGANINSLISNTNPSSKWVWDSTGTLIESPSLTPAVTYSQDGTTFEGLWDEDASTNGITYSEQIDNGAWIKSSSATVTANQATSPKGDTTADLIDISATADSRIFQFSSFTASSQDCVASVFLRSVTGTGTFPVAVYDGGKQYDGLSGGVNSVLLVNLTEKWQRFEIPFTAGASGTVGLYVGCARGSASHTLEQAYCFGAMLESGSKNATSYIPTTSSTVTRTADANSFPWVLDDHTIYIEYKTRNYATGVANRVASLNDGGWTNRSTLYHDSAVDIVANSVVLPDGSSLNTNTLHVDGSTNKISWGLVTNNHKLCTNGGTVGNDTTVTNTVTTKFNIGSNVAFTAHVGGTFKQIEIYKGSKSNAWHQEKTS